MGQTQGQDGWRRAELVNVALALYDGNGERLAASDLGGLGLRDFVRVEGRGGRERAHSSAPSSVGWKWDLLTRNWLLHNCAMEGRLERALSILEEIQEGGDEPDRKSLDLLIKASHRAGKIDTETLDLWNQGGMSLEAAVVEASEQGAESVRADERGGSFWSRLTRLF